MKRSRWIDGVILVQLLYTLSLFGLVIYLWGLTRTTEIRNSADAAEESYGLLMAAKLMVIPAAFALIAWFGLKKGKLWGWWLAVVTNLANLAIFVYSMIDDGWENLDWSLVAFTAAFAALTALMFVTPVRKFYWAQQA
jgi:uncharacterized membrane protein (DUF2068 family)